MIKNISTRYVNSKLRRMGWSYQGKEFSVSPKKNCYLFCGFCACFQASRDSSIHGALRRAGVAGYVDEWSMEKDDQSVKVHAEGASVSIGNFPTLVMARTGNNTYAAATALTKSVADEEHLVSCYKKMLTLYLFLS